MTGDVGGGVLGVVVVVVGMFGGGMDVGVVGGGM